MPQSDWRVVADRLRKDGQGPTDKQKDIAARLGVHITADAPVLVVDAMLQENIADARDSRSKPPSEQQFGYLRDLASQVEASIPDGIESSDIAAAWIAVLHDRRAANALEALQPSINDVILVLGDEDEERWGEIASISSDGLLNLRGIGQRARPHRVVRILRPSDGDEYQKAVYSVRQQAAKRSRAPEAVGNGRIRELEEWAIDGPPTESALLELEDILEEAQDERPLQKFLGANPQVLAHLMDGHHRQFVISLPKLGKDYVPDFLVAGRTSEGLRWTLVEIESPRAPLTIGDGQAAKELRKAITQISDWREWLVNNLGHARGPRWENGLGLVGIRGDEQGLILIGRGQPTDVRDHRRETIRRENRIEVRTYDWLLRQGRRPRIMGHGAFDTEIGRDHHPAHWM